MLSGNNMVTILQLSYKLHFESNFCWVITITSLNTSVLSGDSFKKLSEELASFADYVSEQSARMRSDLTRVPGEGLGPPEAPCGAGALPRGEDEEDKPSMSGLDSVEKELGNPYSERPALRI